jgi:hypothetical protein
MDYKRHRVVKNVLMVVGILGDADAQTIVLAQQPVMKKILYLQLISWQCK